MPSESFLEIGAGDLALSTELLRFFSHGLAVDFTDDLLESYGKIPSPARQNLRVRTADVMTDDIAEQFDCVIACEVMEHIDDDLLFLARVHDLLKAGGQAVISVPARQKFWSVHDELVGHVRRYEKSELQEKGKQAGFERIVIVSYGYPWVNLLRLPRIWLARSGMSERREWSQQQQTSMSNHRQIPPWLANSALPLMLNRITVFPFALLSRLFSSFDLSNGYVITMQKASSRE